MGIVYRDATLDDYSAFLEFAKNIHFYSCYRSLLFDERRVFDQFSLYLRLRKKYFCRIAETDKPVGILYGKTLAPEYTIDLIAVDTFFVVDPDSQRQGVAKRLVTEFLQWARNNGAKYFQIQNGAGIVEDLSGLPTGIGLARTGEIYGGPI